MKRMKFLTVALTLLMGVTMTSCLNSNGDDNSVDGMHFVLVDNFMGTLCFVDGAGNQLYPSYESVAKLEANSSSKISDFRFGYIYYNWPEGEEPVTDKNSAVSSKKVYNIELQGFFPYDYGTGVEATTLGELNEYAPETAPVAGLSINGLQPFQFDGKVIVLPLLYYMENKAETLKQHKFTLACPVDEILANERDLTLYLHHDKGTDDKREVQNMTYYAFNIADILDAFQAKTGSLPKQIVIKAHVGGEGTASGSMPSNYTDYFFSYKENMLVLD